MDFDTPRLEKKDRVIFVKKNGEEIRIKVFRYLRD